jgi:hypothetical protein
MAHKIFTRRQGVERTARNEKEKSVILILTAAVVHMYII